MEISGLWAFPVLGTGLMAWVFFSRRELVHPTKPAHRRLRILLPFIIVTYTLSGAALLSDVYYDVEGRVGFFPMLMGIVLCFMSLMLYLLYVMGWYQDDNNSTSD